MKPCVYTDNVTWNAWVVQQIMYSGFNALRRVSLFWFIAGGSDMLHGGALRSRRSIYTMGIIYKNNRRGFSLITSPAYTTYKVCADIFVIFLFLFYACWECRVMMFNPLKGLFVLGNLYSNIPLGNSEMIEGGPSLRQQIDYI